MRGNHLAYAATQGIIEELVAALGVEVGLGGFGGGGSVKNRLLAVENAIPLITEEVRGGKCGEMWERKAKPKRIFKPFDKRLRWAWNQRSLPSSLP